MWGGKPVQPYEEIRVLVYRMTIHSLKTKCVKVDDLEELIKVGWRVYAVDPDDDVSYSYYAHLKPR